MTLREAFATEYMQQIKKLTLNAHTETYAAAGRRRSSAKGQSVEFSDFRSYTAGDSIKNIDWKSYGRLDKLFIKLFLEERRANVNIILDSSASMDFGGKGLYTKLIAACLSYMFMLNADSVNIYAAGSTPLTDITSPDRINAVVDHLDKIKFDGESRLINDIRPMPLRQGVCILISDFFTDDDKTELFKLLSYKKQCVYAMVLLDKTELSPETGDDVTLEDCETKKTVSLMLDKAEINRYKQALAAHIAQIADHAKRVKGRACMVSTDMNLIKVIKEAAL